MPATITQYQGTSPQIHPTVFLADGVRIAGDVEIGTDCSIWFNAVVRGDVNSIRIGERTNVQDGCVLHVTHGSSPLIIGSNVTIGHGAVVHSATIRDYCLIGMGAIVLDNACVGPYALVAAGAVVLGNAIIPEGVLAAGVPAKVVRQLTMEERQSLVESAQHYVEYAAAYKS
ncbi:MAG TPA: gamma carbonic anhydrase family protein [Bacteroidota bacterium]|nr:gamma carbonic anhydrase family protein [Bacteroidota bacterium]